MSSYADPRHPRRGPELQVALPDGAGPEGLGRARLRGYARGAILAALLVLLSLALLTTGLRSYTHVRWAGDIHRSASSVPGGPGAHPVAIVFGAGLYADGRPTPILRERVEAGARLYAAGKVHKLLLSGDNRRAGYDEPTVMRDLAISLGVAPRDAVADFAGRRTYDTCVRAHEVFGIDRAVLVTERWHLDRAMLLCTGSGIRSQGLDAARVHNRWTTLLRWNLREAVATDRSWLDLHVTHPRPVLGRHESLVGRRSRGDVARRSRDAAPGAADLGRLGS